MNNKVFLGGTCADSTWRNDLIGAINQIDYFNPVVDDWTPECIEVENDEKLNKCNIHLYVITSEMQGVYSIAEVIDSVNRSGIITILHVIPDGFGDGQLRSLKAVIGMVRESGGIAYIDSELNRTARVINYCFK